MTVVTERLAYLPIYLPIHLNVNLPAGEESARQKWMAEQQASGYEANQLTTRHQVVSLQPTSQPRDRCVSIHPSKPCRFKVQATIECPPTGRMGRLGQDKPACGWELEPFWPLLLYRAVSPRV